MAEYIDFQRYIKAKNQHTDKVRLVGMLFAMLT